MRGQGLFCGQNESNESYICRRMFVGKNSTYEGGKQGGLAYGYAASMVDSVRGEIENMGDNIFMFKLALEADKKKGSS